MPATFQLPVAFVGPMGAGKSATARALARRVGVRLVPLDAIRWYYHLTDGFDFAADPAGLDFTAVVRHWEPFSIAAVERVVAEFPDGVIDFGAGHAHYEDPERVRRLEVALAAVPNVVLILPSADPDEADAICRARDQARLGPAWDPSRAEVNARFVRSACFRRVATHTVIAGDRTVDQVVDAVLAGLR